MAEKRDGIVCSLYFCRAFEFRENIWATATPIERKRKRETGGGGGGQSTLIVRQKEIPTFQDDRLCCSNPIYRRSVHTNGQSRGGPDRCNIGTRHSTVPRAQRHRTSKHTPGRRVFRGILQCRSLGTTTSEPCCLVTPADMPLVLSF